MGWVFVICHLSFVIDYSPRPRVPVSVRQSKL
jgi:hypothetical protein